MRSALSKIPFYLLAACAFVAGFAGMALAAGAAEPADGSLLDLLRPVYNLLMSGNYIAASAAALVLAVAASRRYLAPRWSFLASDVGGALLTLIGSFGAAVLAVTVGGAALTLGGAWTALKVSIAAAGGYTLLNKLLVPLAAHAPAWLQPYLRAVLWIFDDHGATEAADAAGDAAVAAKPGDGAKGSIGEATELE